MELKQSGMETSTGLALLGCLPSDLAFGAGDARFNWRLPTKEGVTWRLATEQDLPSLQRHWDRMEQRLGEKQDRPDLFAMPVILTLVAVDDLTGEIDSAIYGECVVDWTMIGTSRRTARTLKDVFPWLDIFLFPRSIRVARMLVPRRIEKHMAKMLPKMRNITHLFSQFSYMVRS